mgnify:CR=1 FL=1
MITILKNNCVESMRSLPDKSVNCCVTSPPYFGLRDYGHDGQIGLEPTPNEFVSALVAVFREVRRVLRDDGTCWINLGDSYAGSGKGPTTAASTLAHGRGAGPKTADSADRLKNRSRAAQGPPAQQYAVYQRR